MLAGGVSSTLVSGTALKSFCAPLHQPTTLNQAVPLTITATRRLASSKSATSGNAGAAGNMYDYKDLSKGNSIGQFEWLNKSYTSPYDMKCPLDCIILYNPSAHANNVAVDDIKRVWPGLSVIQTVIEGRAPVTDATHQIFIPKDSWGDMAVFKRCFDEYCHRNRFMMDIKVGLYPIWSSMAEDASVARAVQDMGIHWIGATPASMDGLGKIEYKQFCQSNNLPTAPFFKISPDVEKDLGGDAQDFEKACKVMCDRYWSQVAGTPLEGSNCFVKSEYGGGGRGTKKALPTKDSIETAIRNVLNDTKKVDGIYVEQALDLSGATLFQIEMEVDAGSVVDGGRLVYFNARNQKMIELGFSSTEIIKYLPEEVFAGCVEATHVLARESKYNGRGTNEILIAKMADGTWQYFCSEFNKRVQVEHKALSHLFRYPNGELFNTIADQIIRSCGYRPPDYQKDLYPSGGGAVAHVRFIAPIISPEGEIMFPVGVEIDESIIPRGFNALIHTGKLYADTDAQFGAALITGKDWPSLLRSLRTFARETVVLGRNVSRDYFRFLQKFFAHDQVRDLTLGCNRTFDVLALPPQPESRSAEVIRYLNSGVARVAINGYRKDSGVKNRGWPTEEQLEEFVTLRNKLLMMPIKQDSPFLSYLNHLDEDRYFNEYRAVLRQKKGGMVSVWPRDVQQECAGSESQIICKSARMLMERVAANAGFVGYEIGGAQFQTAEMKSINSFRLMADSLVGNMPTFSLTRSHWMNALEKLNNEEVKFIIKVTREQVLRRFSLPQDCKVVPYFPNNFHAGNVPEQDEVTGMMLDAGITPVPNFVWDPRFTMADFEGWVSRQLKLWASKGRTLHALRLKNAGQQKEWTAENVYKYVAAARKLYKETYGADAEPIFHVHSHNFNGLSPHVTHDLLKLCQANGFLTLVIDVAPPLMTHSSDLVVAKALDLTPEEWENLHTFNEGAHTIWRLTERFHDFLQVRIDPDTIWAGGTGSSDLAAADKLGIPRTAIESAKFLGAQVSGLGGIVTPYSQWSMVIGYTCYKAGLLTFQQVLDHINAGKTLALPLNILRGLDNWQSLLKRPAHVDKLLENHKKTDPEIFHNNHANSAAEGTFEYGKYVERLRKEIPDHPIDDVAVARLLAYGNIGLKAMKDESTGNDYNWLTRYPEIAYSRNMKRGLTFAVRGVPVTFEGLEDRLDSPEVIVTFKFNGRYVRVPTISEEKQMSLRSNLLGAETRP